MGAFKFLLASFVALILWVQWVEPHWFRIRRVTVRLKKPLQKPLTILHLSDFHFTKNHFHLERFFNRLAKLEPDLILVTGDLIDSIEGIGPCVANLRKLKPRQGIYAVFGNHDYRNYPPLGVWLHLFTGKDTFTWRPESDLTQLKEALAHAGVNVLFNQNVTLSFSNGSELVLVGLDDPVSGRADVERAFTGTRNGAVRIALTHSPMTFPSLSERGVDLAFAGHTHGGQIRIPGLGPLAVLRSRVSPIIDSTAEYGFHGIVSRGMGAQAITRMRLFCRPEAILVRVEGSG